VATRRSGTGVGSGTTIGSDAAVGRVFTGSCLGGSRFDGSCLAGFSGFGFRTRFCLEAGGLGALDVAGGGF
jgi:hypothetical protein